MSAWTRRLPDTRQLEACLAGEFSKQGSDGLRVRKRERSPYSTTFPCEIVTCEFPGNTTTDVFCKYSADIDYTGEGHRGGIAYEVAVYRDVLQPMRASVPAFYGGYVDPKSGRSWLALEYLHGALGAGKMHRSGAMAAAAQWIGEFQRLAEGRIPAQLSSLKNYNLEYYLAWVERTLRLASSLPRRLAWLEDLCARAGTLFAPLLETPQSIIHGEFYPHNVLFHDGRVRPIDWESAAVAAGEIDLASLTENWSPGTTATCIAAYRQERWPAGAPPGFERRLLAAQLYFCFRWLGDREDWENYPGRQEYLRRLRRLASKTERGFR